MPILDPEVRKAYMRKYYAKNKAKRLREIRANYQDNIEEKRAKQTARNRAKGFPQRPQGRNRLTRIPVNRLRRWVVYEDRLYTNSQIGFTMADLRAMMKDLRESITTHTLK